MEQKGKDERRGAVMEGEEKRGEMRREEVTDGKEKRRGEN